MVKFLYELLESGYSWFLKLKKLLLIVLKMIMTTNDQTLYICPKPKLAERVAPIPVNTKHVKWDEEK